MVDYGITWAELDQRPSGTLLSYSSSGTDEDFLNRPGEKDITSHANWDLVRWALESEGCRVTGPTPQAQVLRELGLGELEDSFAASHRELAAAGRGAEAVRSLSRHQALGALSDPHGLGGLDVLCGCKGISLSKTGFPQASVLPGKVAGARGARGAHGAGTSGTSGTPT